MGSQHYLRVWDVHLGDPWVCHPKAQWGSQGTGSWAGVLSSLGVLGMPLGVGGLQQALGRSLTRAEGSSGSQCPPVWRIREFLPLGAGFVQPSLPCPQLAHMEAGFWDCACTVVRMQAVLGVGWEWGEAAWGCFSFPRDILRFWDFWETRARRSRCVSLDCSRISFHLMLCRSLFEQCHPFS